MDRVTKPEPEPSWTRARPVHQLGDVPLHIFQDPKVLGGHMAADIVALLEAKERCGNFLLGCPSGRSLQSTYSALAQLARQHDLDLSRLVIVMMDEYLVPGASGHIHCPSDAHYSCTRFARTSIRGPLNAGLPKVRQIPRNNLWVPDPADPGAFDQKIEDAGGVDIFLIASGSSDGHVAFNPPGTRPDSPTRIVELADSTRRDNLATFPAFAELSEVPRFGVSVGLGTISRLSHRVALVMTSSEKATAAAELGRRRTFQPGWPATIIFECANSTIFVDHAASIELGEGRGSTGWVHGLSGKNGVVRRG